MRNITLALIVVALVALAMPPVQLAVGADRPSTQPARPHRLVLRGFVDGDRFRELFIIVTPEGEPFVATHAGLMRTIERVVQAPATLNWEPSDAKSPAGPEPLDDPASLKALADFCAGRQITFVVVPSG